MGVPTPRTAYQRGNDTEERLQILEGRSGIPARLTNSGRGSTAERDVYFTVPATAGDRAALANLRPTWFNTDLGWEEGYFATTGTAGLTAKGLRAGVASGWYPTGLGPEILRTPSAAVAATAGNMVAGWNTITRRLGGSAWFDDGSPVVATNRFIRCKIPGLYDIVANDTIATGTGAANFWLVHVATDGVNYWSSRGYPVTLNTAFYDSLIMETASHFIGANEMVGVYCHSGSLTVHVGNPGGASPWDDRGTFLVRYIGPALVND